MGVQGHQKPLENTETLMKIDVLGCLVVQEPGVPGPGDMPDSGKAIPPIPMWPNNR